MSTDDEQSGMRTFKEHISAADPWGPPLEVLRELYESIAEVNAAPMRDLRLLQIERAAKAAMAWLSELREFATATLVQQYEESRSSESLVRTEKFQALPREIRESCLRSRQSADRLTASAIDMFLRIWGEYPDVPVSRGCEAFLECPSWDLVHSTNRYLSRRESAP